MQFDLPFESTIDTAGAVELFKSWRSFEQHFDEAVRMRVVTFCDSPEFILELFDSLPKLEQLEVVVGDVADYRERLIDKPELTDRLEKLKREERLVIYLTATKEVHSKLYLIEYDPGAVDQDESTDQTAGDGQLTFDDHTADAQDAEPDADDTTEPDDTARPATVILGSPNLSKNAWSRQANAGLVVDTRTNTDTWRDFEAFYREHRNYNDGGPFLEDLTERLEQTNDDRDEVISLYTEGKVGTQDELGEVHGRLIDHIDAEVDAVNLVLEDDAEVSEGAGEMVANGEGETDELDRDLETSDIDSNTPDGSPQERINLSLRGYNDATKETLKQMTNYDATVAGDRLTTTPRAYQQYTQDVFEVPPMHVGDDGTSLKFHADGTVYDMTEPLPDDPSEVDAALQGVEDYLATVDDYGNALDKPAVKAHMYETLLWFLWAPFANRDAAFYQQYGIDLDKALKNLYIYGESNAGKGTFVQFALSLISIGRVKAPVDADEITKRKVRSIRSANTSFPVVVDDITKQKVNRMDTFRNYWGEWTGETNYPVFGFVSNDKRPDEWFRNRAKILHFDINFSTSLKGEAEVSRLIEQDNRLFLWFAHEYLNHDLELSDDADSLRSARETLLELYEYAGREVPNYFPRRPAEREHDHGRDRWHDLLTRDDVEVTDEGDRLVMSFPESMSTEMYTYMRDPPTEVRVEKRGRDIIIKTPEEFDEWLGEPPAGTTRAGLLERARRLFE